MFSEKILAHFDRLSVHLPTIPAGVEWLLPFQDQEGSYAIFQTFLQKYYADETPRRLILGINPGRFGGGITNIAFTDPWHLSERLGIESPFPKKVELSAQYVYQVIDALDGPEAFYRRFYLNSVCPYGFVKGGLNYNYYDDRALQNAVESFIRMHLEGLLASGQVDASRCFCLGEGKNYYFLRALNEKMGYFAEVVPLAHPRFILQYRRKKVAEYLADYVAKLSA
jgi:Domain of unknown function (DUF4918)